MHKTRQRDLRDAPARSRHFTAHHRDLIAVLAPRAAAAILGYLLANGTNRHRTKAKAAKEVRDTRKQARTLRAFAFGILKDLLNQQPAYAAASCAIAHSHRAYL